MLVAASAGVIDGLFIGNFVGSKALAAVNISMPSFALFATVVFTKRGRIPFPFSRKWYPAPFILALEQAQPRRLRLSILLG